jgi:hypothetical protein
MVRAGAGEEALPAGLAFGSSEGSQGSADASINGFANGPVAGMALVVTS